MKREPGKLADGAFDVLVVGGGINGACVARDAALRGLRVAIIDRGDFVSVTSSNSLRIVHGGLRYLQHLDFRRMRQSIRERSVWLRIAPHFVHPLPCLAATYGQGLRSRWAFRTALAINDLIGWDRNRGLESDRRIPAGTVISRDEALRHYVGRDRESLTGGALWYDAQMVHSERLVLAVIRDAVRSGAVAVNYVDCTDIQTSGGRVVGATLRDALNGSAIEVRAKLIVNASGPAVDRLVNRVDGLKHPPARVRLSKAMNLMTRRIAGDVAVGVPSDDVDPHSALPVRCTQPRIRHGQRLLFVTPWRDLSLVGTTHEPFDDDPKDFQVDESDVQRFLDEINAACPDARLTMQDIHAVYAGLLPAATPKPGETGVRLLLHHRVIDHRRSEGLGGLISLIGVKYTTARLAAEQTVDLIFDQLDFPPPKCRTAVEPLDKDTGKSWKLNLPNGLPPDTDQFDAQAFTRLYGSDSRRCLECMNPPRPHDHAVESIWSAQARYAVQQEMAVRLCDVVFRRTDFAGRGIPDPRAVETAAAVMANELGWTDTARQAHVAEVWNHVHHWRRDWQYDPSRICQASGVDGKPSPAAMVK